MTQERPQRANERRKAVILGASGFIGVNLARALAERGFDLVCFARHASEHWPAESTIILGDLAAPPASSWRRWRAPLSFTWPVLRARRRQPTWLSLRSRPIWFPL